MMIDISIEDDPQPNSFYFKKGLDDNNRKLKIDTIVVLFFMLIFIFIFILMLLFL